MRYVDIKRKDGGYDSIAVYSCRDPTPLKQLPHISMSKRGNTVAVIYMAFDIETTTITDTYPPTGFLYHWQFTIGTLDHYYCYAGRTWQEWITLMSDIVREFRISEEKHLVVYVHNLGYEYQFMYDYLNKYFGGYEVFASKPRKPIKVTCSNGIEFRCSYMLTNMSLEKAVENEMGVIHCKASGDLDYKIRRTSESVLSAQEIGYCISDVVCLHELIGNKMLNEKDTLLTIPLTSTSYVRRDVRKSCRNDRHYRDKIFKKSRMSETVYTLLKEAGRGGDTHANRYLSGRMCENVDSYDVASSYPYQLVAKKYPIGLFMYYGEIESREELDDVTGKYACLFRLHLFDVECKADTIMPYIPKSKCIKAKNTLLDNGRVLTADHVQITVTDIDWQIIQKQYTFSKIAITDMYICNYDYLPDCIVNPIRDYFTLKCNLKYQMQEMEKNGRSNGEDYENLSYLYAKSKNRLNGIFGMMYTDPVRNEIIVDDSGEWREKKANVKEALQKFYKSRNSFLVYAWGVWTTAHARYHLYNLVKATGQGTIYCDTDSSKAMCVDHERIESLNVEIRIIADERKAYADVHDKRYYMGVYEHENKEPIKHFITLGAKKYAYVDETGLHVTISGVSKKTGKEELESIENFKNGFTFYKSAGSTLYYNDGLGIHTITVDGVEIETASNIGMIDSTYTLGITNEYAELINYKENEK